MRKPDIEEMMGGVISFIDKYFDGSKTAVFILRPKSKLCIRVGTNMDKLEFVFYIYSALLDFMKANNIPVKHLDQIIKNEPKEKYN